MGLTTQDALVVVTGLIGIIVAVVKFVPSRSNQCDKSWQPTTADLDKRMTVNTGILASLQEWMKEMNHKMDDVREAVIYIKANCVMCSGKKSNDNKE